MPSKRGVTPGKPGVSSKNMASTAVPNNTLNVEVLPRLQFIERLAVRSSLDLEPASHSDAFLAIAVAASAAEHFMAVR